MNDMLVLITGKSTTGKTASLRNLNDPKKYIYCNTESNKKPPFKDSFQSVNITDPLQIPVLFDDAETYGDKCAGIIIDSSTYMMDQFESKHVIGSENTMQAWGDYAQFFKTLMQDKVATSTKNVIVLAHTLTTLNEADGFMETAVPIKGALKNQGVESYFSMVISTKKMSLKELEPYESALLNITDEEEALGFKYVFQTKLTKKTVNERIRAPMGMRTTAETFIDNDAQLVLDRLGEYYG
jgi:hypothetical protein